MRGQLRRATAAIWIAGVVALAGCNDGGGVTEPGGLGTLIVENRTGYAIIDLRIFKCNADNAGPDVLPGSGGPFLTGTDRSYEVESGCTRLTAFPGVVFGDLKQVDVRVRAGQTVTATIVAAD